MTGGAFGPPSLPCGGALCHQWGFTMLHLLVMRLQPAACAQQRFMEMPQARRGLVQDMRLCRDLVFVCQRFVALELFPHLQQPRHHDFSPFEGQPIAGDFGLDRGRFGQLSDGLASILQLHTSFLLGINMYFPTSLQALLEVMFAPPPSAAICAGEWLTCNVSCASDTLGGRACHSTSTVGRGHGNYTRRSTRCSVMIFSTICSALTLYLPTAS